MFGFLKMRSWDRMELRDEASDSIERLLERLSELAARATGDAPEQSVFEDIVSAVSDFTGAELVILRAEKAAGRVFEIRAASGLRIEDSAPLSDYSISQEIFEELCRRAVHCGPGLVLSRRDLESVTNLIPRNLLRDGTLYLAPFGTDETIEGFFTIGYFDRAPNDRIAAVVSALSAPVVALLRRSKAAAELREKERVLEECREELDSVNRIKSNFLSVVSHELRTPLTSIKAYNETILENLDSIDRQTLEDFLRVMREESERLIALVDNMLSFSRLESGHLKLERSSCNLNKLIEEIHLSLQGLFAAGGIDTEIRMPHHPCRIEADSDLIRQLVQNLMSNAAKFTPRGGKVTVILEEEAAAARIIVQDTGPGIPEDKLEKVFDRFYQVDASDTREHGGSGLGLAICKNIVEWHGGKIWVENVKNSGAKFVVLLPVKDIVVRRPSGVGVSDTRRFERERYLELLVEMMAEFLQARKASIMLMERESQILRIVAAKGLDPDFVQNTRLRLGERIAGKVAESGTSLHVFDIESDEDLGIANNTLFYGTRSFISVPLKSGNETIGVLNVSDHVEGREFTRADRELLESLADTIVGMLRKLDAFEKVSSNFEKLKEAMRSILDMRETWGSKTLMNLTLVALAVGKQLKLDERSLTALRLGMNLYDLGLMRVPRNIRIKREPLNEKELEALRNHTNIGYSIASPMGLEERIMRIIRSHHEHFDGTGYPDGLAGSEIPIEARIVAVVDTFRALMSEGPYRLPYSLAQAKAEIAAGSGTRFDPAVVAAFIEALDLLEAKEEHHELVLEALERELERERKARKRGRETEKELAMKEESR